MGRNRPIDSLVQFDVDWPERNRTVLRSLGLDEALAQGFGGALYPRAADGYDELRKLHDPAFDPHPVLIAVCPSPESVRIALTIAKAGGWSVVCRSGGHSTAGYSSRDDAMVIDLRMMTHYELDHRRVFSAGLEPALAEQLEREARHPIGQHEARKHDRFGVGLNFRQINALLGAYRLHIPGGACSSVCVGGFMQGGGYGFTSRIFGLNIDSVKSFRMMLSDGRIAVASRDDNYDLFWAVRGGTGNNFGVLLDVDYQTHYVGDLWGFGLTWDLDNPDELAKVPYALMTLQADYMAGEAGEFSYMLAFRKLDGKTSLLMRGVVNGPQAEAQAWVDQLIGATGGRFELGQLATYEEILQVIMDQYHIDPDGVDGAKEDKQAGYVDKMLTLQDWEKIVGYVRTAGPILNFVVIEPYGGRIAQIPASDSAFVHRSAHMDFYVDVWWIEDAEKAPAVVWLDGFMTLMEPYFNGMTYQNYPRASFNDYPLSYWGIDAYTELVAIKKKYDPDNFFTFPQAIGRWPGFRPSAGIGSPKLTAAIQIADIVVQDP